MLINHLPIIDNRLPSLLLIYSYLLFTFSSHNHFSFCGTTVAAGKLNFNQKKAAASSPTIGTESESESQSGVNDNENKPPNQHIYGEENCKSEKLKELILETIGLFPHQYSYQARYMKEQAESRFGYWWSAVIISEKGGYGMSAVYDQYSNTTCELRIFDTFYWLGRTS